MCTDNPLCMNPLTIALNTKSHNNTFATLNTPVRGVGMFYRFQLLYQ